MKDYEIRVDETHCSALTKASVFAILSRVEDVPGAEAAVVDELDTAADFRVEGPFLQRNCREKLSKIP